MCPPDSPPPTSGLARTPLEAAPPLPPPCSCRCLVQRLLCLLPRAQQAQRRHGRAGSWSSCRLQQWGCGARVRILTSAQPLHGCWAHRARAPSTGSTQFRQHATLSVTAVRQAKPHPPVTLRSPVVTDAPLLMSANRAAMALPPPPAAAAAAAAPPAAAAGLRSCSSEPGGGGGGGGGGPPGFLPAAAAAAGTAGGAAAAPPPAAAGPGLNWDTGMPAAFQVGPAGKCRAQKACRQADRQRRHVNTGMA